MARRDLESLQLRPADVAQAADFFEAYAKFVLGQPETETQMIEAASALRVAGQWAMLIDQQRGLQLLVESGRYWYRTGHGFGTFS